MKESLSYSEQHTNSIDCEVSKDSKAYYTDFQSAVVDLKQEGVIFSRNVRCSIFLIIIMTNLIINMDHGTIPSATSEIKMDLEIDDGQLGIFGSLVYFGNICGKT